MTDKPTTFSDVVQHACRAAGEPRPNQDDNGICYGVIHANDISQYALEDIMQAGVDLTYKAWRESTEKALHDIVKRGWHQYRKWYFAARRCMAAERAALRLEKFFAEELKAVDELSGCDADELAEMTLNNDGDPVATTDELSYILSDHYESAGEPVMYFTEGDDDNPSLEMELGDRGDVMVFKSPFVTLVRECSPCYPNAGDLTAVPGSKLTYCPPKDWYPDDRPPHPIWETDGTTFKLVFMPKELAEDYVDDEEEHD